jgi:hypothetical protein
MILAQEFSRSAIGRRSDFSTSPTERGIFTLTERSLSSPSSASKQPRKRRIRGALIAQFAANDSKQFADACELISPHVDGVDLNCGKFFGTTGLLHTQLIVRFSWKAVRRNGPIKRKSDPFSSASLMRYAPSRHDHEGC